MDSWVARLDSSASAISPLIVALVGWLLVVPTRQSPTRFYTNRTASTPPPSSSTPPGSGAGVTPNRDPHDASAPVGR